jgi:hypothetical protein
MPYSLGNIKITIMYLMRGSRQEPFKRALLKPGVQQIANYLLSEDSACPPEPSRFMIVFITFSGIIAQRGCLSGGGGGITCRSLKSVEKIL